MEKPTFTHGAFAGFAGFVVLIQLALALELAEMKAMYRDFAATALPALTRLTIEPLWLWGVPLVGGAAVAGLLIRRPRPLAPYIAVALTLAVLAAATWYFPRVPLFALAGKLQAD
jgi:hypothetical protein